MTNLLVSPSVSLVSGRPAVSSLKIADHFEKRHADVLVVIRRIITQVPEDFSQRNFSLASYVDEQGKERECYDCFRDGFILVVMQFTGKKALQIKLAYIAAFNAMEAQIAGKAQPALPETLTPSTAADRAPLRSLVNAWAKIANVHHSSLWPQIRAHFQLVRIDDLPVEWIPDALAFVQGKIDEPRKALPAAEPEEPAEPDYNEFYPTRRKASPFRAGI
jgi:Rha family phage regulatory protein